MKALRVIRNDQFLLLEQGQIPVRTVFRLSLLETIDSRDTSYLNMINELSRKFKAQTETNGFFT